MGTVARHGAGAAVEHRDSRPSCRTALLGVMFYEMLTATCPTPNFLLPSAKAETDPRLDHVVERSLGEDPEERYQKAVEVKQAVADRDDPDVANPRSRGCPVDCVGRLRGRDVIEHSTTTGLVGRFATLFGSDWHWTAPENLGPGINTDEAGTYAVHLAGRADVAVCLAAARGAKATTT